MRTVTLNPENIEVGMAKKILIVEDNSKNRLLLKDLILFLGFEVVEAENGEDGITAARKHKPDLILMDVQMPVMSGFEAAKTIKNDPGTRGITIIAVTSFAMKGDRERILAAGFDDYIAKPINTQELPELINRHLSG